MRKSPQPDGDSDLGSFPAGQRRVAIVYSTFYKEEMTTMLAAARDALIAHGIAEEHITEHPVPGSFEIPLIGAALAERGSVDALIGLGIIVEGETHHARLVAEQCSRGIMDVQTRYRVPFAFEVLYVRNLTDARERLTKGKDAACSVLRSLAALRTVG